MTKTAYGRKKWYFPERFEIDLTDDQFQAINRLLVEAYKKVYSSLRPIESPFHAEGSGRYMAQLGGGTRIYLKIDFSTNPATMSEMKILLHSGYENATKEFIEKHLGWTQEWLIEKIEELGFLVYKEKKNGEE